MSRFGRRKWHFLKLRGLVQDCFAVPFGDYYANKVELLLVIHVLEVAQVNSLDTIWSEYDYLLVVKLLLS